jgi:hypothetical protein
VICKEYCGLFDILDGVYNLKIYDKHELLQLLKYMSKLDMVAHTCILAIGRLRCEGCEFKANLGYTVRLCLNPPPKKNIYI